MRLDHWKQQLKILSEKGLSRQLSKPQGYDWCSNDYLGFGQDLDLKNRIIKYLSDCPFNGSMGSRLVRGHHAFHEALEDALAHFVGFETALVFPSGYQANIALLSSVPTAKDIILSDEYNHASLIDGIRLSRAEKCIFPHRRYDLLELELERIKKLNKKIFIVTESIFSMEGTRADLSQLVSLAEKYSAYLIVDEAHAVGVYGAGFVANQKLQNRVLACTYGAGKALGVSGAWIGCSMIIKNFLINKARPFMFSTAISPWVAGALDSVLSYYKEIGENRASIVRERVRYLSQKLKTHNNTPIIPIMIGDNKKVIQIAVKLQQLGFDIRAIRPPTVPDGTARLRLTVKWCNDQKETDDMICSLNRVMSEFNFNE